MIDFSPILPNLIVGSFPASKVDAKRLVQAGVSALVNLQSDVDFARLGIDWLALEAVYHDFGLAPYRIPMIDFNEQDIARLLPQAAGCVDSAVQQGHLVYLHCTAGQERSPTTAVAWLTWYAGYSLDSALDLVRTARPRANPYEQILRDLEPPATAIQDLKA